jgi:hypothetical protein
MNGLRGGAARTAALGLLAVWAAGCGGSKNFDHYIPPPEQARRALEAALTAWQKGEPPGRIASTSPTVHVVDSHRKRGQRLQGYEILGEVPGNAPRCFAVRLSLEDPREEQKARFVVLGIEPLWVMRHEDLDMMAHWEHPMGEGKGEQAPPALKK